MQTNSIKRRKNTTKILNGSDAHAPTYFSNALCPKELNTWSI